MGADETAYTVKDLILRLDGKVDAIIEALAGKATGAEVEDLKTRVTVLETQSKTTQFILFKAIPSALAVAGALVAFFAR